MTRNRQFRLRVALLAILTLGIGAWLFKPAITHAKAKQRQELESTIKPGDLLFQVSLGPQGQAVQLATGSPYSHMAIALDFGQGLQVLEAVQPVRIVPLKRWISAGENQHFVVKRLKDNSVLNEQSLRQMVQSGLGLVGLPYDHLFEWSDKRIYCSELVWKLYHEATGLEIGALKPMSSYNLGDPKVQEIIKERYGSTPPLSEMMISPGSMFDSPLLTTVLSQGSPN